MPCSDVDLVQRQTVLCAVVHSVYKGLMKALCHILTAFLVKKWKWMENCVMKSFSGGNKKPVTDVQCSTILLF